MVGWAKRSLSSDSVVYRALRYIYQHRHVVASLLLRGSRIQSYFSQNACRKICVGAGPTKMPGWLLTDYVPLDASVIFLDARKPFPFDDASVDYYFTEHMIEHIDYADGRYALQQMFRTLKPNGRLRIATPDLHMVLSLSAASIGADTVEGRYIRSVRPASVPVSRDRVSFAVNNLLNGHGHRFVYDAETLEESLTKAGFVDIRRRAVGESDDPVLRNLEKHGDVIGRDFNELETMVIEARKPNG